MNQRDRSVGKDSRRRRGASLGVAWVLAALTAFAGFAWRASAEPAKASGRYAGMVSPSKSVILIAPLEGLLKSVSVQEGQRVKAGEVLAVMDDGIQKVVVESAKLQAENEAEVRKAAVTLEDAKIQLDRIQAAAKAAAANEWEVRRTKLQVDQAEAMLDAAKAQLAVAKVNVRLEQEKLDRYILKAPFDGTVVKRSAEPGSTLTRTDPIVTLAALETLEAQVFLPIELYGKVELGKTYKLAADEPVSKELQGKLKTIDPIFDTASRTFRVVLTIDNPGGRMPAGFTVNLVLP